MIAAKAHGIEGILKEELLDLTAQAADEALLPQFTPTARSIPAAASDTPLQADQTWRAFEDDCFATRASLPAATE